MVDDIFSGIVHHWQICDFIFMQPVNPSVNQNFFISPRVNNQEPRRKRTGYGSRFAPEYQIRIASPKASPQSGGEYIPYSIQPINEDYRLVINFDKTQLKDRWSTSEGKNILARWRASGFSRSTLDSLVGKFNDHTDLRGIRLLGEDLSSADLTYIDFYGANLASTNFSNANLDNSYLSETNIAGTNFSWAKMDKVYLDNVDFNSRTIFKGVNVGAINFTFATLLQELIVAQARIIDLERKRPILALFLKLSCDYGRSFLRFFFWCLAIVFSFALLYTKIPGLVARLEAPINVFIKPSFFDGFYLSAMTFITIGTDVFPISAFGKILMLIEGSIGYLMTGLLVAILVKRTVGE